MSFEKHIEVAFSCHFSYQPNHLNRFRLNYNLGTARIVEFSVCLILGSQHEVQKRVSHKFHTLRKFETTA